jgi:hypothetical protein
VMSGQAKQTEIQKTSARKPQTPRPTRPDAVALPDEAGSLALRRAMDEPVAAGPGGILALQRAAGNRAVGRLIQAKLTVGAAGDRYEQEADRVAEQVMGEQQAASSKQQGMQRQEQEKEVQAKPLAATITPLAQRQLEEEEVQTKQEAASSKQQALQRQEDEEELQTRPLQRQEDEEEIQTKRLQRQEDEEELQTKRLQRKEDEEELQTRPLQRQEDEEEIQTRPLQRQEDEEELQTKRLQRKTDGSFEAGRAFEDRLAAQKGGGRPLPAETRAFMEPRFGADFGGVRVHTGSEVAQLNRQVSAQAFTHGQDIYMGAGYYNPGSQAGKRLLAHELTHVVQQVGANKLQRRAGGDGVKILGTLPSDRISLKLMHLDFVRMKRQETHIAKMLLSKLKLAKEPEDAYGHWWTEIGDLEKNEWRPAESYGWWPSIGVNILSTLRGVKGILNRGNKTKDPHHGDDAKYFHPVADVGEDEKYEDVRNRVVGNIRSFAAGFKGRWSWRLGWGKNCHTFQEKLMSKVGMKKSQVASWLKKAAPQVKEEAKEKLPDVGRKFKINAACEVVGLDDMGLVGSLDAGDGVDVLDPKFESGYAGDLIPIAFEQVDERKKGRVSDWYLDKA